MAATRPTLMVMERPTYVSCIPATCAQSRLQGPACVLQPKPDQTCRELGMAHPRGHPGPRTKMEVLPLGQNPNPGSPCLTHPSRCLVPKPGRKYFSHAGPDFQFIHNMAPSLQSGGESVYTSFLLKEALGV